MQTRAAVWAALALILGAPPVPAQNSPVVVTINAGANRHPISPLIYGVAYGSTSALNDLGAPLNRYGGNNASRYNWQLNADNRGNDWYFESIADTSAVAGERGDTCIRNSHAAGAEPMITIPMIGWVAKLGASRGKLASFSQAKYGAQTGNDAQWYPDAGNGVLRSNGRNVTGNDPNDANVASTSTFQQGWVQHMVKTFGAAGAGGLRYYILDNEPSIWQGTHRDVHPTGATMDEIRDKIIDYAAHIKAVDPGAYVVGPEEWGWSGYLFSGYDQQYGGAHGWSYLPDRSSHNNMDYVPYLLDQLRKHDATTGQRSLDVFSLHYYPQGGEYGDDTSTSMQLLRNQSTRSLWDPNYVDKSWINSSVMLIPRMRNWVNSYYPSTRIALTEYNWGAEGHINGATTQADIYGIFGREGLDMAARWTYPDPSTPTYKAMKMYGNYDGNHHGFGDTSVACSAPNPDNLSAFAAVRSSDGALTVMVINKVLSGATPVTISLAGYSAASAQAWQLTSANAITRLADLPVRAGSLGATVPPQSVTLFVLGPTTATLPTPPASISATAGNGQVALAWTASTGATSYNLYRGTTSGGEGATTYKTGLTAPAFTDTGLTNGTSYYYQVAAVNSAGAGARSAEASAKPLAPPAPAAPTSLAAGVGTGQVALTWAQSPTPGVTQNRIYRSTSSVGTFSLVATVPAGTSYVNTGLRRGIYYYRVTAVANGLESAPSNIALGVAL